MLRAVISLRGIRKLHLSPQTPPVLDGIDLSVAPGETCGLCGPGAAGKSLLLKILCGLVRPDAGAVQVAGCDLFQSAGEAGAAAVRKAQASIGALFQNNALFDSMTVYDNVAFPLRQQALQSGKEPDETAIGTRVRESLRGVGLGEHIEKMPSQLSGGQRKRVALARAVVARPPILLYDEPTAGLDPVTTAKVYELLRREREESGATVILVSSDVPALRAFAPRMLMLYRGRLRYDGPAAAIESSDDPAVRQFVRGDLEGPL
jgi:phospholipid/cholesterol/gamma-HCH transport system ATP-binding protein